MAKKQPKLKTILKNVDLFNYVLIYVDEFEEPEWEGYTYDIPWYFADYRLHEPDSENYEEPIAYRESLGEKYDNKRGWIIWLTEKELPKKKMIMDKFLIMGEIIQLPYEVVTLRLLQFESKHPFLHAFLIGAESDKPYDYRIIFITIWSKNNIYIITEDSK